MGFTMPENELSFLPEDEGPRSNFLPYPRSTPSPRIVPTDLSSFKARGASKAQRVFRQQLTEMQERYQQVIDQFNWNKLVYESAFTFQPVIGETYHLYQMREGEGFSLSLIGPGEWSHRFVGSFRLDADGRWELVELAEGFDLQTYLEELDAR